MYAVYTQKRDVTRRLETILAREGIRVAVLTSDVPTEKREAWFERKLHEDVQVTICHPKIIETGLDLLSHPSLIFYQSGYSLHTLRQASRRSWRIGQRQAVRVFHLHYAETMQSSCLRLMAKKMLVSLAMEGKFSDGGLQSFEEDDDILTAMARELVTKHGIGESADALWKRLQAEQLRPQTPTPSVAADSELDPAAPPPVTMPTLASALKFGQRPPVTPAQRQPDPPPASEQFSLF
ncbi:MAG TPA: helicase-related protein [Bryobacteraceae bacterium]|nr:helicase-related protein [Bryobacteraceae bacterium]